MSKPRQEFLGPITKLAAIDTGDVWVSDGYGVVDGYGAEIHNVSVVLNALSNHPTTGAHRGSFWAADTSPTTPKFTNSIGVTIDLGSGSVPIGDGYTVYWSDGLSNQWSNSPVLGAPGTSPQLLFGADALSPYIAQDNATVEGTCQDLTISAQNTNFGPDEISIGGNLWLEAGFGPAGDGSVYLWAGRSPVILEAASLVFDSSITTPSIGQQGSVVGAATSLTIFTQSGSTAGGNLTLQTGADTTDNSDPGKINLNHGSLNTIQIVRETLPPTALVLFAADLANIEITQASTGGVAGNMTIIGGYSPSGIGGSLALLSGGGSSGTGVVILGASGSYIQIVGNSDGKSWSRTDGYIQLTEQSAVYDSQFTTEQSYGGRIVATNANGFGSYTINPYAANQGDGYKARADKQFGTFKLVGTVPTKTLTFSTTIHGHAMPENSVLFGKMRVGWCGDGSYTNGGAMEFLFTVTSDAIGNVRLFSCGLSDNTVAAGSSTTLTSGLKPAPANGDCDFSIPSGANTPLLTVALPLTSTNYSFVFQAINNPFPTDVATYVWEVEYMWGSP